MSEKYQNQYRIPSARAPWHGYDGCVYFVTICTKNREHYFGEITTDCRDGVHTVSTGERWKSDIVNVQMQIISKCKGRLSVVVGGLKRSITHYANTNNIPFAWQSRFHDRIVRDQDELNRIATYIENNVAQWHLDEFNKL